LVFQGGAFVQVFFAFIFGWASLALADNPVDFEIGNYLGRYGNGRACEFAVVPTFGGREMSFFVFEGREYYRVDFRDPLTTPTPGEFSARALVMRDGRAGGKPYYRAFYGAPIYARVYEVDYKIQYRGNRPTGVELRRRRYQATQPVSVEFCRNLRKQ
jgi:hypothetical protein